MKLTFDILRRPAPDQPPYREKIPYETDDPRETVATALTNINAACADPDAAGGRSTDGMKITPIRWEGACLQRKCGACAMVINGTPRLACDTFLRDYEKKGVITLEPLSKFPIVADLIVDRRILFENLKTLRVWSEEAFSLKEKQVPDVYDASRCLQCGLCLEVCPNVSPDGDFMGAAGFVPNARRLSALSKEERAQVKALYQEHVYEGCGKSLACEKICPAGIEISRLLSRSNAIMVWRRHG